MHVRDVGLAAGGADDPRRGPARAARAQARRRPLAAAPDRDAVAPAAAPRPLPARDADRAPDGGAAHAVRRVRACERRRRAREPEGVRGDRPRVRALPRRVPAGRGRARRASGSSTGCGRATRPTGSATCARRSRATSAARSSATRRRARSSPCSRTSRSASTSRRACSRRSARRSTPRTPRRRISGGARSRRSFPSAARWWPVVRRPAAAVVGVVAAGVQRAASRLAREVITESFMVLSLPGRVLALGTHLADAYPEALREPADAELRRAARAVRARPAGARRLRRPRLVGSRPADALHRAPVLRVPPAASSCLGPPFTPEQVASFSRGVVPDGEL